MIAPTLTLLLVGKAAVAPTAVVTLDEVVRAAVEHHPRIRQARGAVDEQAAARLEARGAFDTRLEGDVGMDPLGYYPRRSAALGVEQRLPVTLGPSVFGGWRAGSGFAPYDGKRVTGTLGEVQAGVRLQLMRDLFIDAGRFGLRAAELKEAEARAKLQQTALAVAEDAAEQYLGWAVSHQRLDIARALLALAEDRQAFVEKQVRAGALPRVASSTTSARSWPGGSA